MRSIVILIILLSPLTFVRGQAFLTADGPGNTYERINSVLAPSGDVVEHPECVHPEFGRHIAEVWDAALGKYVFEFYIHVTPDNDRCINFDRQRMEIKTYDASPAAYKGVYGETVTYKWRFWMPVGYRPSPNFTHIHQVKAVGGNDDDPLITLTVRKGSPNKVELIHNNTTKVAIVNQSLFEGNWVECTEIIKIDSLAGTYSMVIRNVATRAVILSYSSASIMTIRSDNDFIRPKWGIYRSLLSSADLRDDTLRFTDLYVGESTSTAAPAAPSALAATVLSSTQVGLTWTDNASNEESFRIERSANGSVWDSVAAADPNATTYTDAVPYTAVPYYYRLRSENTFGPSAYTAVVSSVPGNIVSVADGLWSSGATWSGGMVPTASDNVEIAQNDTVTIDVAGAACNGLSVHGSLTVANADARSLTVNGDLSVASTGNFNVYQTGNPSGLLTHTLTLKQDLTVASGGRFDMRRGSGSNVAVGTVVFNGPANSVITLAQTTYQSGVEEFNAVTIDKSSGAKVVLASGNLFMSNNNSTGPSVLNLSNGIIETGSNTWVHLSTSSEGVTNASVASYVDGALGRGGNTSAGTTRTFEVGDAAGYRPVTLTTSAGITSGGYLVVRCVSGDAGNGGTLLGGIDRVSSVRYYDVTFRKGTGSTDTGKVSKAVLNYAAGDGVAHGNTALRVAFSTDGRQSWMAVGQTTPHVTSVSAALTPITPDNFPSVIQLKNDSAFSVTLANATGGGNTLPVELTRFTASGVHRAARLEWETATESNSASFDVERNVGGGEEWRTVERIEASGNAHSPRRYSYIDSGFPAGVVRYRLRMNDRDGTFRYSGEVTVTVGAVPNRMMLGSNFPNPFNPVTAIEFSVERDGRAELSVFTPLGQKVAELFRGRAEAGRLYYVSFDAAELPSGVYLYRLTTTDGSLSRKMLLVK